MGAFFSVVAIDIDHFKKINDRFARDEVLMAFAAIFMQELRWSMDLLARVGGDEFMLLLPGTACPVRAGVSWTCLWGSLGEVLPREESYEEKIQPLSEIMTPTRQSFPSVMKRVNFPK